LRKGGNLPENPTGALKNAGESIIAKRGIGKESGDMGMVVNIFNGFLEVKRRYLVGAGEKHLAWKGQGLV
jgi:hypothetical protein